MPIHDVATGESGGTGDMPHDSYYDGNYVIVHTVKRGESLSKIAAQYKFKGWHPIWIYNTQVEHAFATNGNPNQIESGQQIFIPRSEEGYKKLLKKLENLKLQVEGFAFGETSRQEGLEDEYKATAVMFDFAGDVATLLGSLAVKAAQVARYRQAKEGLKGAQLFAADIKLREGLKDLEEAVSKTELGKKFLDFAAAKASDKFLGEGGSEKTDNLVTFGNKTVGKSLSAVKGFQQRQKLGPALKALRGGSLQTFLDGADIVLDYVKVSNVANAWLWLTTGETVEGTIESSKRTIEASSNRSLVNLNEKILKIQKEREWVYGSSSAEMAEVPPLR
jgi:hypothetical protein